MPRRKSTALLVAAVLGAVIAWSLLEGQGKETPPALVPVGSESPSANDIEAIESDGRETPLRKLGSESTETEDPAQRTLTVTVLDADSRAPVAGVLVNLVPFSRDPNQPVAPEQQRALARSFVSDEDGRGIVSVTRQDLVVMADYETWAGRKEIRPDVVSVELFVRQQNWLEVRCIDASGAPLADLSVDRISGYSQSGGLSDANGLCRMRIEVEDPGPWQLRPSRWIGPNDGFPIVERSDFTDAVHRVDLRVPLHGAVRVRLNGVEADDELRRCRIRLQVENRPNLRTEQRFRRHLGARAWKAAPVALGQRLQLTFVGWPHGPVEPMSFDGPRNPGEVVDVDLKLPRPSAPKPKSRLQVVIRDADGALVRGETLRIDLQFERRGTHVRGESDDEGKLVVDLPERYTGPEGIPLEDVAVTWLPDSRPGQFMVRRGIDSKIEGLFDLGEVRLQEAPTAAQGRVVDSKNAPIADAEVVALRADLEVELSKVVRTNAEGRFTIEGPVQNVLRKPKPFRVRATKQGFAPALAETVSRGDMLDLVLTPAGSMSVTLEGFQRLPTRLRLYFELEHRERGRFGERLVDVGKPWELRWDDVPVGTVALQVRADRRDKPLLVIDGLDVRAGEVVDDPRLTPLDLSGVLRMATLQLRFPKGVATDEVLVWRVVPDRGARGAKVDPAGRVSVLLPPAGESIDVMVKGPGLRTAWLSDFRIDQEVRMEAERTVRVRVLGLPDDKDPTDFKLNLSSRPFDSYLDGFSNLPLDAQGVVEMTLLPAGDYEFSSKPGRSRGVLRVPEVVTGDALELRLQPR